MIFFSFYLIIDTQLIIKRGDVRIEEDDYIVAAVMIWIIDACVNAAQGPYRALIPDNIVPEQHSIAVFCDMPDYDNGYIFVFCDIHQNIRTFANL